MKDQSPSESRKRPSVRIPAPAHPDRRREPLPWNQPKPAHEDPEARHRIEAILASPSYRQSDQDADVLERSDVRGVRLQIDYLKPELLLEEHGIEQTIVVFGSTRIHEPATAQKRVDELRRQASANPDMPKRRKRRGRGSSTGMNPTERLSTTEPDSRNSRHNRKGNGHADLFPRGRPPGNRVLSPR